MSLARYLIDKSVSLLGGVLKYRKISNPLKHLNQKVCVNLGCGLAVTAGWNNVDASLNALFAGSPNFVLGLLYRISGANRYYSKNIYCSLLSDNKFIFHDLARSLPFESSSVDFFYSSHFFEHLFRDDAKRLLREMYVALKPDGAIRIAVPNLNYAVNLYASGNKYQMLDDYFFVNDMASYLARHKYMYDFELLSELLNDVGYKNIRSCMFGEGGLPDLDKLDNRPTDTLFVEATK